MFEIDFCNLDEERIKALTAEKLVSATEEWEINIWQFIRDWFNPGIKTIAVYTSGSTGNPKKIEHTKSAMLFSAAQTCKALHLKPGDKALLCLPVNKISGMMMVVRCIQNSMRLTCIKPSSNPFNELNGIEKFDFAAFTPMQFYAVTESKAAFEKANNICKIILGGEDVKQQLLQQIKRLDAEVYITFGMTETISHIALKRLNGPNPDADFKLLPEIDAETDEQGRLLVKAPRLGQAELLTNDIVQITGPGRFVWLGRADNIINTGGVKIYPEEIEQKLASDIPCPFFISSLPDEKTGERLVIAIEEQHWDEEVLKTINTAISKLEKLKRPKTLLLLTHFERTPNGKIKRKESMLNSPHQ